MELKGIGRLREKLPGYPGRRIALLLIGGLLVGFFGYGFLIILDTLPRLFADSSTLVIVEPALPLVGSCIVGFFALRLTGSLWIKRDQMKRDYGGLAYQHMLPRGMAGVLLIPSLVFHVFTSVRSLPPGDPVNDVTEFFSQSILGLSGIATEVDVGLRLTMSGLLLILGILTIRSAVLTFGVDYMAVVYLYFPEESQVQNHEIYSVIRHPAYFAVILIGAAGLAFRLSVYSILIFAVIYTVMRLHIRREERELIARFGSSYAEYREKVPGLHVSVRNVPTYLRFLLLRADGNKGITATDSKESSDQA